MQGKEKMKSIHKYCGIAVFAGLILAIALFTYTGVFAPGSSSRTTGTASAGGFQYTVTPIGVTRNAEGQITVEVEVVRKDSYRWTNVTVRNISVTGQPKATAKLISTLPTAPIPERFVLKFLSDAIDSKGEESHLRFQLNIKAAKHFGLSNAGGQRSISLPLVPMESVGD